MGVDITAVLEYAEVREEVYNLDELNFFGFAEIHLGRNSPLFSLMAGVRGSNEDAVVYPRGLPKNSSDLTKSLALVKILKEPPTDFPTTKCNNNSYKVVETFTGIEVVVNPDIDRKEEERSKRDFFSERPYSSVFDQKENLYIPHSYYSHSWLTLNELTEVYAKLEKSEIFDSETLENFKPYASEAILSMMRSLEKESKVITRLVFWFDN